MNLENLKRTQVKTIKELAEQFDFHNNVIGDIVKIVDDFLTIEHKNKAKDSGEAPLHHNHQCFKNGHSMYPVYSFQHTALGEGLNKCSRCGHEERWVHKF